MQSAARICGSQENKRNETLHFSGKATAQVAKPQRTIAVRGIPDGLLEDDVLADILTIHFQKAKNKGGDVEDIVYPTPTKGVAYITFEDRQVAENVVAKAEHSLQDKRLPVDYPLKVSLYRENNSPLKSEPQGQGREEEKVFTSVSCLLDLSILRGKNTLEDLVGDLQKNFPVLSFGTLHPDGQITVEGPFSAIRSLQNKLVSKRHHSLSKPEVKSGRREDTTDPRPNTSLGKTDLSLKGSNNFVQSTKKERLIIALDTDVYLYMKTLKKKLYQERLKQCGVISHEFRDGEVTTVSFDHDPASPSVGQLEIAKNIVEDLAESLQSCLRKERLSLEGFSRAEKRQREQACENLRSRYPRVLIVPYSTHIDVIGMSSDIFGFMQQVDKMVGRFQKEPWR
ncbi:RNA-binding protein 43 isoform X2 [Heteronotia binoei]|uniref:RNA-binding protein 43 isoform X2 n=1 Tax=Heteronotia binoei TaxID=13085 RepID=UPI002931E7F4|nr:RNA-binding protein 43 isoform X2 [Heteronotia binoei]